MPKQEGRNFSFREFQGALAPGSLKFHWMDEWLLLVLVRLVWL